MKSYLRDHPKLMAWPPMTGGPHSHGEESPAPHEGTLYSVKVCEASTVLPIHLEVIKEFNGHLWTGLVFPVDPRDHQVVQSLFGELQKLTGQLIAEISNLQFDL